MTTKPKTRKAAPADPIFALIAAVKAAEKELYRCVENNGADVGNAWSAWHTASMRLARTKPTTLAGAAALSRT
jgi:hypothetical protein